MQNQNKQSMEKNVFKAVLLTHLILLLHLLIIVGLGVLVIFFRGVTQYMLWIFLGGIALIALSGFLIYRRIRARGRTWVKDLQDSELLRGRNFEVSFLGGVASVKVGNPTAPTAIAGPAPDRRPQLEDPRSAQIRKLTELAEMLKEDLITLEEYNLAKKQIFKSL